jgi:hypothetical protein
VALTTYSHIAQLKKLSYTSTPTLGLRGCSWMNFTFTIYCDINITAIIIRVIAFTGKTNVLYYTYKLWDSSVTRTDTIKDLGGTTRFNTAFPRTCKTIFSPNP